MKNFEKMRNGQLISFYKPIRRYRNRWTFADLSKNTCEQIWRIGQEYYMKFREGPRPRHSISHPVQLVKYFYFLYLTGCRLMEPIKEPVRLSMQHQDGGTQVIVRHLNEKHPTADGNPDFTTAEFPVFDEWEQKMWLFITDGAINTDSDDIFRFKDWGALNTSCMSHLIDRNFFVDLKDLSGKAHRHEGLSPHILRHMRAFNVVITHNVRPELAITWFGWKDIKMLYYYAHIKELMSIRNQHQILKRDNLLTLLTLKPSSTLGLS